MRIVAADGVGRSGMTGPGMDLQAMPAWVAWVFAIFGSGLLVAVLVWIRAPAVRGLGGAFGLGGLLVLLLVGPAVRGDRASLWFGGGFFGVAGLALLLVGRLPTSAPPFYNHPRYPEMVRRGRLAGVALVALEVAWIVAFAMADK